MTAATRLTLRDLLSEAVAGLAARPARTALTVLGTVLGIGALVATAGISQTAGNRIVGAFDELEATSVVITNEQSGFGGGGSVAASIPRDAEDRIARLSGVRAVGTMGEVDTAGAAVSAVRLDDPGARDAFTIDVYAASPGLAGAIKATLSTGRWFDAGHDQRADPVAILGRAAADRLLVFRVDQQPVVFIGERPFTVIGVLDEVDRQAALLDAVIIPDGVARRVFRFRSAATVQIDVALGAGDLIAEQAPIALRPNDPELLRAEKPPSPESLRNQVQGDVNLLFLLLGAISLLVGAIGIANVTLVSVLERVGEIGLRGALGARRRHIAAQFLLESTAMGLIGGVVGAALGILAVVAVAAARQWTPVITPAIPLLAPLIGGLTGLLAGLYPATRAAALEPVDALRAGT